MKQLILFLVGLALTLIPTHGFADPEVSTVVFDEYSKAQQEIQSEWVKAARKVSELESLRTKAVVESQKRSEWEKKGVELLNKYQTLLKTRYRGTETGFTAGLELTPKDQENINRVLTTYLATQPLKGRVSVGEASRVVDWAVKRLSDVALVHSEPKEENNSDLEILGYQMSEATKSKARFQELAKAMGVDLSQSVLTKADAGRTISSTESN